MISRSHQGDSCDLDNFVHQRASTFASTSNKSCKPSDRSGYEEFLAMISSGSTNDFGFKRLSGWKYIYYQDTQENAFWLVLCNKKPPKSIPLGVLVHRSIYCLVYVYIGELCERPPSRATIKNQGLNSDVPETISYSFYQKDH